MSFNTLGLCDQLLRALNEQGYTRPTPIQQQAIPIILGGRDILAAAQTGTGKTAAFTLPLLQRLSQENPGRGKRPLRALILTPTRELAAQVSANVATFVRHLPLRSTVIYGGVAMHPQVRRLQSGTDLIIATPGRLLDHVRQKNVDLSTVEYLVLDEADRMLDMGFIPDIRHIISQIPTQRRTLLFSATFSPQIRKLAAGILNNPEQVKIAAETTAPKSIRQEVHFVRKEKKHAHLSYLIGSNRWEQVLVFTRTKRGADKLSRLLERDGLPSTAIHGDKTQGARTRALDTFKKGKVRVLVATDVAARGLDIEHLPYVVNYELPQVAEDYVHRIGRTGRAGNEGTALSLVSSDESELLRNIERLIKRKLTRSEHSPEQEAPDTRPAAKKRSGKMKPSGNAGGTQQNQRRRRTTTGRTHRQSTGGHNR